MSIYKVLPDLEKKRQLSIWHKALRSQWSAADLDWTEPHRITSPNFKVQLGRVQQVLDQVPPIFDALEQELTDIGIDRHELYHHVATDSARRLDRSIDSGFKVASQEAEASQLVDAALVGSG